MRCPTCSSAWGDGMLRGEVSSNHVLTASRRLDAGGEAAVEALGFAGPTYGRDDEPDSGSLNFHVDLEQTEADRLAVMSVRALRDVFGVLDPAFLEAEGPTADAPVAVPPSVGGVSPDEPAAVFLRDGAERLREPGRRGADPLLRPRAGARRRRRHPGGGR